MSELEWGEEGTPAGQRPPEGWGVGWSLQGRSRQHGSPDSYRTLIEQISTLTESIFLLIREGSCKYQNNNNSKIF